MIHGPLRFLYVITAVIEVELLTFFQMGMGGPTAATELSLAASQRLDINLSTTFAEIAINTLNTWAQEGAVVLQKARATYAPYRIRNETGSTIHVWSDIETNASIKDIEATKVLQGQTIDWRFDDWRALREVRAFLSIVTNIDNS